MIPVITLIGMPGVGKSTIGKLLADRLDFSFVDLDILIRQQEGVGHSEVMKEKGEETLLKFEEDYALKLDFMAVVNKSAVRGLVFAPGGSIIYSEKVMEKLHSETTILFLDLPFLEIKKRLGNNVEHRGIVGLSKKSLEDIFKERLPMYRLAADHTINCVGLADEDVVEKIRVVLNQEWNRTILV
ncbi:MAG: hypothetical protein A3I24_01790 [Candidatus Harrisonbacteria bacterium RIFCSPLOWO2_02_FULL_41_13b]|uniref:Shikimate kinase n=1 Tax=Candidatus Harrisonbacteria bacterium RIFCSPLOWO2_02_FULL_41_13b TaxID=1798409 RepID=A0A1G1ZX27_9BACT|nr:MAG: hypothetical protein A2915_02380 [Candidatus Yanofskybacteria bacterium RIFCSPLOWO2_01_FULL_41_34]OGY63480.1 MAG: hypothetical protein A3J53_01210 [Candidatus Harrisonbacteria bacterium RIFCSPHIGHO2_02_FULL_40_20]OGY68330.1 MAG: hypothetical protein A3I24_01790 [Candidatus Harrisonbacteria bacterium RIFCSPLOWO2_02_FULL_41_13b]